MGRYIKRFGRVGFSLGPSEERGFEMWVGYDIENASGDLPDAGLIAVDEWSDDRLAERGVIAFQHVAADDRALRHKLGIE
jgi:hypothetical protein